MMMSSKRFFLNILIGTFVLGTSFSYAQSPLKLNQSQISDMGIEVINPASVSSVWSQNYPAQIRIPNAQIRVINSMLSGLVNVLYVAEGDEVIKGQKLAEISSQDYLQAQQSFLNALSSQTLISRNHTRNLELMNEGIISEKNFGASQSDLQAAEAELSSTRQALLFSGMSEGQVAELQNSRILNKTMVISAPFDGVVLKQTALTGQHLDEMSSLYQVGQLNPLWVEIHVPYHLASSIQVGNKIRTEGSNEISTIITIGRMVHEEDQGIIVRGILEKSTDQFMPGQFVNVTIEQKTEQSALFRIPLGSIIRDGNDAILFKKMADGFSLINAQIIADEGQSLVVAAPINVRDEIAFKGLATLKGMLEGLGSEE